MTFLQSVEMHGQNIKYFFFGISGQCGITLNVNWAEPLDFQNETHIEASNTIAQFALGWFAHAIFINGDYPQVMKDKV